MRNETEISALADFARTYVSFDPSMGSDAEAGNKNGLSGKTSIFESVPTAVDIDDGEKSQLADDFEELLVDAFPHLAEQDAASIHSNDLIQVVNGNRQNAMRVAALAVFFGKAERVPDEGSNPDHDWTLQVG